MKGNRRNWIVIAVVVGLLLGWTLLIANVMAGDVGAEPLHIFE